MSTIQLSSFEKKIMPECSILFCTGIWRSAKKTIEICNTSEKRRSLFEEVKTNIYNPSLMKLTWNGEVFNFGGDEFGYVGYFKSNIINAILKLAFRISPNDREITIGFISIATVKEGRRYLKHAFELKNEKVEEEKKPIEEANNRNL